MKVGEEFLDPQIPRKYPKIWRFPPKTSKIGVNSREIHAFIQTATQPPFRKGTYMFSTIPTEKNNTVFKLDLGHLFCRWSITRPIYTRRGLLHLVNNHALDLGLLLRRALREGREIQFKERRRMPSAEGEQ